MTRGWPRHSGAASLLLPGAAMLLPPASRALLRPDDLVEDPPSLLQHYSNGSFDSRSFLLSRRKRRFNFEDEYGSPKLEPTVDPTKNDPPPRREYRKRSKRIILGRRTEDGTLEHIPPTESMWYQLYVSCPQTGDKRFETKFRAEEEGHHGPEYFNQIKSSCEQSFLN